MRNSRPTLTASTCPCLIRPWMAGGDTRIWAAHSLTSMNTGSPSPGGQLTRSGRTPGGRLARLRPGIRGSYGNGGNGGHQGARACVCSRVTGGGRRVPGTAARGSGRRADRPAPARDIRAGGGGRRRSGDLLVLGVADVQRAVHLPCAQGAGPEQLILCPHDRVRGQAVPLRQRRAGRQPVARLPLPVRDARLDGPHGPHPLARIGRHGHRVLRRRARGRAEHGIEELPVARRDRHVPGLPAGKVGLQDVGGRGDRASGGIGHPACQLTAGPSARLALPPEPYAERRAHREQPGQRFSLLCLRCVLPARACGHCARGFIASHPPSRSHPVRRVLPAKRGAGGPRAALCSRVVQGQGPGVPQRAA